MNKKNPNNRPPAAMHSEDERVQVERDWANAVMSDLRTHEVKRALKWLQAIRKRRNFAQQWSGHDKSGRHTALAGMYNEAIDMWAAEVSLFLRDLRKEMAEHFREQYPDVSEPFVKALLEDDTTF